MVLVSEAVFSCIPSVCKQKDYFANACQPRMPSVVYFELAEPTQFRGELSWSGAEIQCSSLVVEQ